MNFSELLGRLFEIIGKMRFPDEAHFHLDGYVSKQNAEIWALENPYAVVDNPLHAKGSLRDVQSLHVEFLGQCFLIEPSQATPTSVSSGTILCLS
jgi:hypothetical protein